MRTITVERELTGQGTRGRRVAVGRGRRELREETGPDAEELTQLGNFFPSPGSTTERLYAFMARELFASALAPDDDERISVVRVPFAHLVANGGSYGLQQQEAPR